MVCNRLLSGGLIPRTTDPLKLKLHHCIDPHPHQGRIPIAPALIQTALWWSFHPSSNCYTCSMLPNSAGWGHKRQPHQPPHCNHRDQDEDPPDLLEAELRTTEAHWCSSSRPEDPKVGIPKM
eukprot:Skav212074  [mRNA]  locus=scaffold867:78560:81085:- [translate_table: standard]